MATVGLEIIESNDAGKITASYIESQSDSKVKISRIDRIVCWWRLIAPLDRWLMDPFSELDEPNRYVRRYWQFSCPQAILIVSPMTILSTQGFPTPKSRIAARSCFHEIDILCLILVVLTYHNDRDETNLNLNQKLTKTALLIDIKYMLVAPTMLDSSH